MRTKFERKKMLGFTLGILISFLFTGNASGGEITITSDSRDFMCPVRVTNGLIAPEAPWQGAIPRQTNCNACRGMSNGPRGFYDGSRDSDVSREYSDDSGEYFDDSGGFLMCRTARLCDCQAEHTYQ